MKKTIIGIAFVAATVASLCASGGERAFLKCGKPLRFVFSEAENLEFHLPGVKEAFAAIPPESRPREFYITCRAVRLDGSVFWKAYSAGSVSWRLPISQVGRVETLKIRPEIVSMRKTAGYDYSQLKDLRLVGSGSGEIEIFEVGTTDVGPKPVPHDAGLPPVGIDDFAIFPEPRIFKQEGERLPLKVFGGTYRLEGDVPPAPVSRFVRDMKDFYGIGLKPSKKARIAILVTDRIDIPGYDQVVHDGFAISATKRGICVAAKDPRGIAFGLGVLSDSIKMVSGDVGEARVPLMTVVDWPRMGGVRLFNDMVQCSLKYQKYDADFYVDMFEKFVLASRFNMLAIEPSDSYKWASAPYSPVKPSAWDRAEFEHIVDRVNANAVSVVPKMNGLGHVNHWPLGNAEANRRYGEDGNKMVLSGVPSALPSLIKAYRIQDKARNVGFDWEDRRDIWKKVKEEISEFEAEVENMDKDKAEAEFGDVMFSLINAARLYKINPDNALERTNQKFIRRFNYLEEHTIKEGINLKDMTLEEMDAIWDEAKEKGL